jgi:amidase
LPYLLVINIPFGITFAGTAYSEGKLIKFAYAFEQATNNRKSPIIETEKW